MADLLNDNYDFSLYPCVLSLLRLKMHIIAYLKENQKYCFSERNLFKDTLLIG